MKNVKTMAGLALLIAATVLVWTGNRQPAQKITPAKETGTGAPAIGGDFTLTDQDGKTVHASDYRGKLMLIYFGYTHCPTICPVSVGNMSKALDLFGSKADGVVALFITVDPARDTPAALKDYLANFNKHVIGLTGTDAQIKTVTADYKAYFAKQGAGWAEEKPGHMDMDEHNHADANYLVNHSGFIYLMDKDGKYVQLFQYNASPQEIAAAITPLLK